MKTEGIEMDLDVGSLRILPTAVDLMSGRSNDRVAYKTKKYSYYRVDISLLAGDVEAMCARKKLVSG